MCKLLTSFLLIALLNTDLGLGQGEDLESRLACGQSMGYNTMHEGIPVVWNPVALVSYCSAPGRTEGQHCTNDHTEQMGADWADSGQTFNRKIAFVSQTLDYACSNVDVIDANSQCLEGQLGAINQCFQNSFEAVLGNRDNSTRVEIAISFGRQYTTCTFDAVREHCAKAVADVIGNFLYAGYVYVHEAIN